MSATDTGGATVKSSFLCGPLQSILGTYLTAVLCAVLYRFPVPLVGYASGVDAVLPTLVAVTVYGVVLGGFVVQGLLGWAAGKLARRHGEGERRRTRWLCAAYGWAASIPGVVALAVLDKIIGHW